MAYISTDHRAWLFDRGRFGQTSCMYFAKLVLECSCSLKNIALRLETVWC